MQINMPPQEEFEIQDKNYLVHERESSSHSASAIHDVKLKSNFKIKPPVELLTTN